MVSKVEICNLALSNLGASGTVENIDNPIKNEEKVFAKWYEIARKYTLRLMIPGFAKARDIWPKMADYQPAFGYKNAYAYRADCLRVLGIGNLDEKFNDYAVEGGYILTNIDYKEGLPVRFIKNVTNTSLFTEDFVELFSWILASKVCMEISRNKSDFTYIQNILPDKIAQYCGTDSQENKPIRISRSPLQAARRGLHYGVGKK